MFCTLPQTADDAGAILCLIGFGAGVDVDEVVFEHAIDQDGELAGRGSATCSRREERRG